MSETVVNLALLILGIGIGMTISSIKAFMMRKIFQKTFNNALDNLYNYLDTHLEGSDESWDKHKD